MSKRLIDLATRVRRRVRDPEIIDLCDEALRVASSKAAQIIAHENRVQADDEHLPNVPHTQQEFKGGIIRANEPNETVVLNTSEGTVSRFDKTAYMRDYMRKKRAKENQ